MGWLQKVARMTAKHNIPLEWVTPSGFVARQTYMDTKLLRVETRLHGKVVRFGVKEPTDKLDASRQSAGLSPNFIHSMDAAALALTVCTALRHGITSFAMIHDSYGTHAANTDLLGDCLRSVFVDIYQDDILGQFYQALQKSLLADDIPSPPARGSLDITEVMQSVFFFS